MLDQLILMVTVPDIGPETRLNHQQKQWVWCCGPQRIFGLEVAQHTKYHVISFRMHHTTFSFRFNCRILRCCMHPFGTSTCRDVDLEPATQVRSHHLLHKFHDIETIMSKSKTELRKVVSWCIAICCTTKMQQTGLHWYIDTSFSKVFVVEAFAKSILFIYVRQRSGRY